MKVSPILIADEHTLIGEYLVSKLKEDFAKIYYAQELIDALEIISNEKLEIIIIDCEMILKSKVKLRQNAIRKLEKAEANIIFTNTRDEKTKLIQDHLQNPFYHLPKPFKTDEVKELIHFIIGKATYDGKSTSNYESKVDFFPEKDLVMWGYIRNIEIPDILQFICNLQGIYLLTLQSDGNQVDIFFKDYNLLFAKDNNSSGVPVVYKIFEFSDGIFFIRKLDEAPPRKIFANLTTVILEGLKRQDEKNLKLGMIKDAASI